MRKGVVLCLYLWGDRKLQLGGNHIQPEMQNGMRNQGHLQRREFGKCVYKGDEHLTNLNNRDLRQSPLWRHCLEVQNGEVQEFEMNVTRSFKNDAMLRQITEAVQIDNTEQGRLMNTRAEWNMTRVPRATIT